MTDRTQCEDGVPAPEGWIRAQDADGNLVWIDPSTLKREEALDTGLSDGQIERIRQFSEMLGDANPIPLEKTLENFEKERDAETEIQVWEHITAVFQEEVRDQQITEPELRRLLLGVILECTWAPSVDAILASLPGANALPNFEGIVQRFATETDKTPVDH